MLHAVCLAALALSNDPFPRQGYLPWPAGTIDEVHLAFLGSDRSLDAVVRSGGTLRALQNAGSVAALSPVLASGVVDSATLGGGGPSLERVAFTTSAGLYALGQAVGPVGAWQVTDLAQSSWAGRALHSGPWGSDSLLVGVGPAEMTAAVWDGSTLTSLCNIPFTGTVHAVDTIDWDGDGSPEIVAIVDDRMNVYTDEGIPISSFLSGVPGGRLAISRSSTARDVALWEVQTGGSNAVLVAQNASGYALTLIPYLATGVLSVDQDGDGDDDLVRLGVAPSGGPPDEGELYVRVGPGSNLAGLSSFAELLQSAGTFNIASGCAPAEGATVQSTARGDVDNDGDEDFLIAYSGVAAHPLRADLNGTNNEVLQRLSWDYQIDPTDDGTTESVTLGFYTPMDSTYYDTATHVEVQLWTQDDPEGLNGKTFVPGASSPAYRLLSHAPNIVQPPVPTETFPLSYPLPQPTTTTVRMYVVTQVELDANDVEVSRGPSNIIYFAPSEAVEDAVHNSLPFSCIIDPTQGSGPVEGTGGGFSNPPPPVQPGGGS